MWTQESRARMADIARKTKRYPSDLTDEEWERIAQLMPKPPRLGRKPAVDCREILNAIRYMAQRRRLVDAAQRIRSVADHLLVVLRFLAPVAVSHHPRRRAHVGSRACGTRG
jgi:hypothetical protein